MLTAARFTGADATALGFADFTGASVEELEAHERKIRKQVLQCAPGAVAGTKELVILMPGLGREAAIRAAAENFADRMLSDEGKEGLASFMEKRPPSWAVEV